ncbi:UPF0449 protein C19orf25 homolog [Cimex lectularius]|uniref:Uncharacterized protein n=1 Tax=Cimex lectularius TaxID=79782 RepID=A0A8I6RXX1_CIMLE|nr:UPF0449 protein C19orf25 homolog [Cimex lectularius]
MFKKKTELPVRPKMPQINQVVQDVENAPPDDPVFASAGISPTDENSGDSFSIAQEFMATTQRLKELEMLLVKHQNELKENHRELLEMVGTILQEAVTLK